MPQDPLEKTHRSLHLSNLQVVLILLTAGAGLLAVTWIFAVDIGRVPISLWDICTTVLTPATDAKK